MEKVPINKTVLRWAREEARLSLQDAALRAGIQDVKARGDREGLNAWERLEKWEDGVDSPSFPQLEKIAKAYRRPVLTFFLASPPSRKSRIADFRTVGDNLVGMNDSPEFSAFIRQIEGLQRELRSLIEEEKNEPLGFIGSATVDDSPKVIAESIRGALQFSLEAQMRIKTSQDLFTVIRERAEKVGILILLQGNLGSYHTNMKADQFRGLAISDSLSPMIVINPDDPKVARLFSLLHELAHLWLGETGVSNNQPFGVQKTNQRLNEVFCNKVAAEFLVPEEELRRRWTSSNDTNDVLDFIKNVSRKFKVSRIVVARRMLEFGFLSEPFYWSIYRQMEAEWRAERDRFQDSEGAPGYLVLARNRLGKRLLRTLIEAAQAGRLSLLRASQLMNVKVDHFDKLYDGVSN